MKHSLPLNGNRFVNYITSLFGNFYSGQALLIGNLVLAPPLLPASTSPSKPAFLLSTSSLNSDFMLSRILRASPRSGGNPSYHAILPSTSRSLCFSASNSACRSLTSAILGLGGVRFRNWDRRSLYSSNFKASTFVSRVQEAVCCERCGGGLKSSDCSLASRASRRFCSRSRVC